MCSLSSLQFRRLRDSTWSPNNLTLTTWLWKNSCLRGKSEIFEHYHDVNFKTQSFLHIFQHCNGDCISSQSQGPHYEYWTRWALFKHPTFLCLGIVNAWEPWHIIVHSRDFTAATLMSSAWLHCASWGCKGFELFLCKSSIGLHHSVPRQQTTKTFKTTLRPYYLQRFGLYNIRRIQIV